MKNYLISMNRTLAILLLLLASLLACEKPEVTKELYSILLDTTDKHIAKPDTNELLRLMNAKEGSKQIYLRYSTLTDVDFNQVQELSFIPEATGLLGNEVKAKRKRVVFEREVKKLFQSTDTVVDVKYSAIFDPIINELKYMGTQSYSKKRLIVYSNLMENSDLTCFYKSKDYSRLLYNQTSLIKRYVARVPKFPTDNLELQVVYIPHHQKDNRNFKALQRLYTEVFRQLDIPISFTANLYHAEKAR